MNILVGSLILAFLLAFCAHILLAFCAHILVDVWQECRFQTERAEHEELLDELWGVD